MAFFESFGRRKKNGIDDEKYLGHDHERLAYNDRISRMRKSEYPMLKGLTYLDHGGTTLAPRSLLKSFCTEMQNTLLANPHSDASNPSATAIMVEETRLEVLKMFNADPAYFDVVFTANATAAIKLVAEGFSGIQEGFNYLYHRNSHTSLVGVRELARRSHCLASDEVEQWLASGSDNVHDDIQSRRATLFAYPAQSNMNGERLPLNWAGKLRLPSACQNAYTLLDVAALVSTTPLDLSNHLLAPDFIALSFYKIFGFPDLGALIAWTLSGYEKPLRGAIGAIPS
ncbi:molybdenum cofactor sulfurase [Stemphylium lycopersici]|uniref:Molybdenum cofactor sulfurase n=1 Tax=Stemphylium lycopersici TaxID=183478 RepID=A0A364MRW2_STELY|nr:molybdenum cofactor sulfurase [Stemphylium lycopersici]RAR01381.1 molybdenum cofactor sulfurase [Stemphylium lycopersici]